MRICPPPTGRSILIMTACALAAKTCIPCRGGIPPLKGSALQALAAELGNGWGVVDEHHLAKNFTFKNFREALDFTNRIGAVAEEQGHHPDLAVGWGYVHIRIWTHKIDGLAESDFILAAKIDALP
mgnify:CR=1 FL=1